jgi:hypothetical protein
MELLSLEVKVKLYVEQTSNTGHVLVEIGSQLATLVIAELHLLLRLLRHHPED